MVVGGTGPRRLGCGNISSMLRPLISQPMDWCFRDRRRFCRDDLFRRRNVFPGSSADVDSILAAIAAVHHKMAPLLTDLTGADRKSLSKLGDKSHAFVKK